MRYLPSLSVITCIVLWASTICHSQISLVDSPFLYRYADSFADCDQSQNPPVCFTDTVAPDVQQNHRPVPIRIRVPRGTTGALPLILWSHGGGLQPNGRALNETWGRTLTRAGYIVIHMSHIENTPAERAALCLEFGAASSEECLALPLTAVFQPRDASVVFRALDWIEQNVPGLAGRIDRGKIAVAGWSGGSLTALAHAGARFRVTKAANDVSFENPLPRVFLANSPQGPDFAGFKADSWRLISRPVLISTGPSDVTGPEDASSRLFAYQGMPRGNKYQLYIDHPETIHATFNLENPEYPQFSQWLVAYTLAFFDHHLKSRAAAGEFLISQRLPVYGSQKTVKISRK